MFGKPKKKTEKAKDGSKDEPVKKFKRAVEVQEEMDQHNRPIHKVST